MVGHDWIGDVLNTSGAAIKQGVRTTTALERHACSPSTRNALCSIDGHDYEALMVIPPEYNTAKLPQAKGCSWPDPPIRGWHMEAAVGRWCGRGQEIADGVRCELTEPAKTALSIRRKVAHLLVDFGGDSRASLQSKSPVHGQCK